MSRFSTRSKQMIVVDFCRGSIKLAAAESACEAVRFRGVTQIALPAGVGSQEDLGPSEVAELIGKEVRIKGWTGMRSACLLSRAVTSTQSFLFPPMPEAELRQAIALKLRQTLHFDFEEASFDYRRVRTYGTGEEQRVLVLVATARKDAIKRSVSILREAGLRPVAIGAAAESLANLALGASLCHEDEATVYVDVGSESTILNMFDGHILRFSREIETGGKDFTSALMRPIITPAGVLHLTFEQAEEVKALAGYPLDYETRDLPHGISCSDLVPLMEPVAQRLCAEMRRSIDYLGGLLGGSGVDRILLSGPAGQLRNLDTVLAEMLGMPVEFTNPVARSMAHWRLAICDETPPATAGFSAILGYSLGAHQPINLLPREEKLQQVSDGATKLRKTVAPVSIAMALCLAAAAVPIDRTFGRAQEALALTGRQLDERLEGGLEFDTRFTAACERIGRAAEGRGVVPDWVGIMKEFSSLLSEETSILALDSTRHDGVPSVHFSLRIEEGARSFYTISTELTLALSRSPFFRQVHVIDATPASDDQVGSFEATLELVARPSELWRTSP